MIGGKSVIVNEYMRYKDRAISFYDELLKSTNVSGSVMLLEVLKELEQRHTKFVVSKDKKKPGDMSFSDVLSLTPINELPSISKVMDDVLSFRQEMIDVHFEKLKKRYGVSKMRDMNTAEKKLYNFLLSEKTRCNL